MSLEVVAAIIFFENKILVTQRKFHKDAAFSYKFEFPGGKVENNEDKITALRRELLEELNLELTNFKHFTSYNYSYDKDKIKLHFFLSNVNELKLTLKVHEAYKLVTIKQLSKLDWLAADYEVIKKLESKYL
jgi:8-oxo-dGTP diphosphatase